MQSHESVVPPSPASAEAGANPGQRTPLPSGVRAGSRTRAAVVVLALLASAGTTACGSGGDGEAASTPTPPAVTSSSSGSASAAASPSPSPSPSASESPAANPSGIGPTPTPGPSVIPKATRPGQPSRPTVTGAPSTFKKPVSYPDGIKVTVDKVSPGVETGRGPGVFAGREFAVFTVTMTNGTSKPIDAQSVVVTSTYGGRDLVAERVYAADTRAVDFGGQLAPGDSATARYAFAVPAKQLGDVRLVVDFDGTHTSAEFVGDARQTP